jgi:endonuclease/exonuclease/phosphatase family metal-dependent hydrolase
MLTHTQPAAQKETPKRAGQGSVSAVTLNVAREADAARVVAGIQSVSRLRDADVFLFQEVVHDETQKSNLAQDVARELGYFVCFAPAASGAFDQGLGIVSRYPLADTRIQQLKRCDLRFRSRDRFAIAATVRTPRFDLRVWNAHLDTRINAGERVEQLQPVIDEAARYPGPRLIGGDFNTNELYWLGNVVPLPGGRSHGATLRQAMKRNGFETPLDGALNTYPALRRHLDWIFVAEVRTWDTSIEPAPFSDHRAVWVRLGP